MRNKLDTFLLLSIGRHLC